MSQRYPGGLITNNGTASNSVYFNGSSNLTLAGASQYSIPNSTTPFTIEYWIKPAVTGGVVFTEGFTGAGNTVSILCSLCTGTDVSAVTGLFPAFGWWTGSAWVTAASSTTALVLNVWSHVALVFTGSTSRVYINGINVTKSSSPTPAITWGVTGVNGDAWYISRAWGGATDRITGNLSNFRFVNGTAVYTANFPVPVNLLAITNTVLLTCQPNNLNSFITDKSFYGASITNTGPATVVPDNPFIQSPPYNPALGAATPGVWELNEAATAAAQRSWNMYDPFFNLNTAMVHGNGTNGGTNNTFLDSSTNNFAVTRNGNTTQGTFTPFSLPAGYWSNYFDGSDYLQITGSSNLAFGTGDWTIEFFFYYNRIVNTAVILYDGRITSGAELVPTISIESNFTVGYATNGALRISSGRIATSTWQHLVVSRVSGNTRMFINGVQAGSTYVDATNYISNSNRPYLGTQGYGAPAFYLDGYISNLRVLKGTGTTAPTVPTEPLTAITNTQLLTCQNNRFVDSSANAYVITRAGDVRTIGFSPFYNPTAYLPQKNGGGMFFDGNGDYLTLTGSSNLAFGTSDFTIECFVYYTSIAANSFLYDSRPNGTLTGLYPTIYNDVTAKTFVFYANGAARLTSNANVLVAGAWTHLVISRVSGTTRMFVNGTLQTATYADTNSYLNGAARPIVSADGNSQGTAPLTGYVSNLRVLNGTGVTSVTVPTAPLTAITNTQLLLSGTNAAVFDNAANLIAETNVASISTAQSKFGGSSMVFNGTSSYVRFITPYNLTTTAVQPLGDFTVEGWVNPASLAAAGCLFYINGSSTSYATTRVDMNATTGALTLLVSFNNAGWSINVTTTQRLVVGTWTHIAVVRTGGNFILYFNGVAAITNATIGATTILVNGEFTLIGALYNSGYAVFFNGYISDFRATNYARYLGNFTPPTSTLQNQ